MCSPCPGIYRRPSSLSISDRNSKDTVPSLPFETKQGWIKQEEVGVVGLIILITIDKDLCMEFNDRIKLFQYLL